MSRIVIATRCAWRILAAGVWAASPALLTAQTAGDEPMPAADSAAVTQPSAQTPARDDVVPGAAIRASLSTRVDLTADREATHLAAIRQDDAHVGAGKHVALMVVGAAVLITGLVVGGGGGTALAVAGGALGLYGLYGLVK
jgi:hypothetical protein